MTGRSLDVVTRARIRVVDSEVRSRTIPGTLRRNSQGLLAFVGAAGHSSMRSRTRADPRLSCRARPGGCERASTQACRPPGARLPRRRPALPHHGQEPDQPARRALARPPARHPPESPKITLSRLLLPPPARPGPAVALEPLPGAIARCRGLPCPMELNFNYSSRLNYRSLDRHTARRRTAADPASYASGRQQRFVRTPSSSQASAAR